ncbi:dihydrofolate reductase family protein [Tessaracoccus massiliensis]|uniref:dihydrofolate reductase family protein n=1 Tax=Tessaracoccus massiliensis TaxID=1522311 RepID=UPI000694AB09|nr:dihydrofolate reductase family protein [Tessaracoccus massiliensis]
MAQVIVTTFLSLDGVMENPQWTFTEVEFDPAAYELKGREQEEAAALLLGRQSYTEFAPCGPP